MTKHLYFFILCLFGYNLFSQKETIDSLFSIYNGRHHDTIRLNALNSLTNYTPPNETCFYNDKMIEIAEADLKKEKAGTLLHKRYLSFVVEGYYNKGVFFANLANQDSALFFYNKAIDVDVRKENKELIAYCQMSKAIIYKARGLYDKAIELLYQSLEYHEKTGNQEGIGDTYMNLGVLNHTQKNYVRAKECLEKSFSAFKKADYRPGMIDVLCKSGANSMDMKDYDQTVKYFQLCNDLSKKFNITDSRSVQFLNYSLALLAYKKGDWKSATEHSKKCITLAREANDNVILGSRYYLLAGIYMDQKKYADAIVNCKLAMALAKKDNDIDLQMKSATLFANIYQALKEYKPAFEFEKIAAHLNDSLQKSESKMAVLREEARYEFEKRELLANSNNEKAILKLNADIERKNNQKNKWIIIGSSGLLVVFILFLFLYKHQKQKTVIEKQKSNLWRQKMLLSQMNPHFIFNSINSIQNYVLNKNEDDAYNYLAKFGKLIRMVLQNSREDEITIDVEIETLALYVELEQLRFDNKFEYLLNVSEEINVSNPKIPAMLIQPYVENAILHGLMNLNGERNGALKIDIEKENNLLKITIEDNGVGRMRADQFKKESIHQPVAMKLTGERIEMINELGNTKNVKITVIDLYDNEQQACGTRVELFLPLTS
jgi:tetratricopeptide (TPR) repeat protein